ncbi:LapA family protein [Candidatus Desantisbacteria bacterium]|nr:LapA family protein [Candidatus Desantisbacteria bacterium]
MQWKFFSSLLLILIFIFFTSQNWEMVTLKIFSYSLPTTLAFIIVLSLLIGFILGTIVSGIKQYKLQK